MYIEYINEITIKAWLDSFTKSHIRVIISKLLKSKNILNLESVLRLQKDKLILYGSDDDIITFNYIFQGFTYLKDITGVIIISNTLEEDHSISDL